MCVYVRGVCACVGHVRVCTCVYVHTYMGAGGEGDRDQPCGLQGWRLRRVQRAWLSQKPVVRVDGKAWRAQDCFRRGGRRVTAAEGRGAGRGAGQWGRAVAPEQRFPDLPAGRPRC